MKELTLEELVALEKAVTIAYTRCAPGERDQYGDLWVYLLSWSHSNKKDLTFEQERNPLPFPEN
jgi:hypothetical protein